MDAKLAPDEVLLPGGRFWMGSDHAYQEEAPAREMSIAPFMIDQFPVTNRKFAAFVRHTSYITTAEIAPSAKDYPCADPALCPAAAAMRGSVPAAHRPYARRLRR